MDQSVAVYLDSKICLLQNTPDLIKLNGSFFQVTSVTDLLCRLRKIITRWFKKSKLALYIGNKESKGLSCRPYLVSFMKQREKFQIESVQRFHNEKQKHPLRYAAFCFYLMED